MQNANRYLQSQSLLLISLAEALLSCGCSTHRLEEKILKISVAKGLDCEILVVPTGIHLQLRHQSAFLTRFVRVKKLGIQMAKLHDLADFCDNIVNRGIGTRLAKKKLEKILQKENPYPQFLVLISSCFISMFFQFILGGAWIECLFCAYLGLNVYFIENYFSKDNRSSFLSNFISSFIVSLLSVLFVWVTDFKNIQSIILSGLIILTPGLGLTNSIAELSHRQFLSGSSRLIEAILTLLSISFGVYLAIYLFGVNLK